MRGVFRMKVLYCTSEARPFAATGGLADVAGSLPQALRARLIGCRVVMPLYEEIPQNLRDNMKFITSLSVPVAWRRQYCGVFEARSGGVIYYLIDNQYYFKRKGLYGHYDDAERFAFLSRAVLEMLPYLDFRPMSFTATTGRRRSCRSTTASSMRTTTGTAGSRRCSRSTTFSTRASTARSCSRMCWAFRSPRCRFWNTTTA